MRVRTTAGLAFAAVTVWGSAVAQTEGGPLAHIIQFHEKTEAVLKLRADFNRIFVDNAELFGRPAASQIAGKCAEYLDATSLGDIRTEFSSLVEFLELYPTMNVEDDREIIAGSIHLHAISSKGSVSILKSILDNERPECTTDVAFRSDMAKLRNWVAQATPILDSIEDQAVKAGGAP
jgi:hypothetical protein